MQTGLRRDAPLAVPKISTTDVVFAGTFSGEQANDPGELHLHLGAFHHHVDDAVFQQVFGALEAIGELFTDGLLNKATLRRSGQLDTSFSARSVTGGFVPAATNRIIGQVGRSNRLSRLSTRSHPTRLPNAKQAIVGTTPARQI
jgi:hypothetical protein